jgi:hypothetical protein
MKGGINMCILVLRQFNDTSMDSTKAEILTKWYLRLNGYFTVDNFIVHNPDRIPNGVVSNSTETDVLAIRLKHSKEIAGQLHIANDGKLLDKFGSNLDFVIAEVKTGNEDKPNKVWRGNNKEAIKYITRFAGIIESEEEIALVADKLLADRTYEKNDKSFRIRLIIFSEKEPNKNWKNVTHIFLEHIVDFILQIRGQCWIENEIGVASIHYQWDELINSIFEIANKNGQEIEEKKKHIMNLLS